MNNATTVLRARSALRDAGAAARDTATWCRNCSPRSARWPGPAGREPRRLRLAALERFEVRAQRVQLDVTALATGAANPGQAAQHLAESADYMGQVIQGLPGGNTGLGAAEGRRRPRRSST